VPPEQVRFGEFLALHPAKQASDTRDAGGEMIDDLLGELFGEVVLGRLSRSRRAQLLARLFFGLLGTLLGLAGALQFTVGRRELTNSVMQASVVALFLFVACFSLFNVALGRRWRWPGIGFALSFVGLFAARILFGP
jgi:hypothetical protein